MTMRFLIILAVGMFFQRALKSAGVFYRAYAALRFNRKAPNLVISRGRNDKHKLILKKITLGACLFAPLPGHSLQRTPKIFRPAFSGWFTCASKPWRTAATS
jgi:hypothetical protein